MEIKELVYLRNLSAHTGNYKKEDVDIIRDVVYKLITILNKVNEKDESIYIR